LTPRREICRVPDFRTQKNDPTYSEQGLGNFGHGLIANTLFG
jgi:hypothetical protein